MGGSSHASNGPPRSSQRWSPNANLPQRSRRSSPHHPSKSCLAPVDHAARECNRADRSSTYDRRDPMAREIRHVPDKQRYEVLVDGQVAGFADYRRENGRISFLHTEVDDAYAGQGLAKQLVTTMLDEVAEKQLEAVPV